MDRDIERLARLVRDGIPTLILCDNAGQAERLDELLGDRRDGSPATLAVGVLDGGFVIPPVAAGQWGGLRVLTDHEIFRRERRIRRVRRYATGAALESITALQLGDYVVHLEHGVGIFRGIETIFVKGSTVEVAVVEYEGGDRLNVPLYRIDQLERYRAAADVTEDAPPPRLHRLGGKRWAQQRDRTRSAIHEMTRELLELYAHRQIAQRPPHAPDTAWQRQLESSFLFEDTPDQRKATLDVKTDLERNRPMDRLLVGDVGYGKTEIAVRAAFKAIQSGRQVAVLVPTTILADQHLRTFGDRYADFPIRVAVLSRFQTAKDQQRILAELTAGTVDLVIGTHRLLSPDVVFKELGLIVIDEEHRFGVKHKERLKQLRLQTDVLTLTATPIPRTLHLALAGLRDMTLMQTPPRDRSPVLTFLEPWDDGLIEEGIGREIDRGGRSSSCTIGSRRSRVSPTTCSISVPRARIAIGHGQMRDADLEAVMRRYVNGEVDVLVSTMIVESGLDVPNANTMFINRADMFGLAQLYQLRGRVGRSHRRAYCYLMVPDAIDEEAERRLQVLEHHTELGSGYRIALRDMELRGAGNILGPEQSGHVQTVGFDLYLRMLDEQVRRLQHASSGRRAADPADVSVDVPAYLPDDYVPVAAVKLDIYRRLTRLTEAADIECARSRSARPIRIVAERSEGVLRGGGVAGRGRHASDRGNPRARRGGACYLSPRRGAADEGVLRRVPRGPVPNRCAPDAAACLEADATGWSRVARRLGAGAAHRGGRGCWGPDLPPIIARLERDFMRRPAALTCCLTSWSSRIRSAILPALLLGFAGCRGLSDALTAHVDVAARASGTELLRHAAGDAGRALAGAAAERVRAADRAPVGRLPAARTGRGGGRFAQPTQARRRGALADPRECEVAAPGRHAHPALARRRLQPISPAVREGRCPRGVAHPTRGAQGRYVGRRAGFRPPQDRGAARAPDRGQLRRCREEEQPGPWLGDAWR